MTGSGLVLCYLPRAAAWEKKLRPAMAVVGARVKRIQAGEAGESVGFLAGVKGFSATGAAAATEPDEPVLVLCGLVGARLDAALRALRQAGVPREVYRAVLTGENAKWSFAALAEELKRERTSLEAGRGSAHGE